MKNSKLFILGMLFIGIMFLGFQCASTELTSAKLYYDQKNYNKAIEMLQAEVKKNPKSDEGYFWLGQVYLELDSLDKMVESFDKSLAISKKFETDIVNKKYEVWSTIMHSGLTYYNRSIITSDDDSVKILLGKAIPDFQSATIVEPDSGLGFQFLAISFLRTGDYDDAVDPLKKLIEIEQAEVGYQYLGEVYYAFGENSKNEFKTSKNSEDSIKAMRYYTETINTLEVGLLKYPDNSDMLTYRTNAYINTGRIEEAITSARALVDQDPTNAIYHYNYGVLLMNVEKYPEAETELKKVIELDPENEDAIYNLGVTYVKWGTAMNKEAENQGQISEDYKKKYEASLPYLEKVVEKDPTNVAIWELLGKVYSVLGMTDDANNAFKKADELK